MKHAALVIAVLLVGPAAIASEEMYLGWAEVRVVGQEHDVMGRVAFSAEVRDDACRKVEAKAFGKKYALNEEQCARLQGFPLNSLKITHESGYDQLGGYTVHFKLRKSFYREAKLVHSEVVISISRGKGLSVSEPRERADADRK